MATEEQVHETLQLLQAHEALIAALKAQLQIESAPRSRRWHGQVERKRQEGVCWLGKGLLETKARTTGTKVKCWSCGAKQVTMTVETLISHTLT